MSESRAKVFYGVKITKEQAIKFVLKNENVFTDLEEGELAEAMEVDSDVGEFFSSAAQNLGFGGVVASDCMELANDQFFVTGYDSSMFSYDVVEEIDMPTQAELDETWAKAKEHFKTNKKPKWYLSTCIF